MTALAATSTPISLSPRLVVTINDYEPIIAAIEGSGEISFSVGADNRPGPAHIGMYRMTYGQSPVMHTWLEQHLEPGTVIRIEMKETGVITPPIQNPAGDCELLELGLEEIHECERISRDVYGDKLAQRTFWGEPVQYIEPARACPFEITIDSVQTLGPYRVATLAPSPGMMFTLSNIPTFGANAPTYDHDARANEIRTFFYGGWTLADDGINLGRTLCAAPQIGDTITIRILDPTAP